jgi:hypothetical protein
MLVSSFIGDTNMKWIALTDAELELVTAMMELNEESLADLLHYPDHLTPKEENEYLKEQAATLEILKKLLSA